MLADARPRPIASRLLTEVCEGTPIRHGFFTREGGVSSGIYRGLNVGVGSKDEAENVRENRRRVCRWFSAAPDRLATPHQIHSADVLVVDDAYDGTRPKADAVVTATPGIVAGILTADCGPVLFADARTRVVGAAHAGWRGALDGILESTVEAMIGLGARREDIGACLGPSISQANYEVGPEFRERFISADPANERYFTPSDRPGHAMFDLPAYTLARLKAAGIEAESSGHCTYDDEDRFFSYRRATHRGEPDYGRQIAAIAITE